MTPTPARNQTHDRPRRSARTIFIAAVLGSVMLLPACASKPRGDGQVVRMDEITQREREAYALARQAADAERAGNNEKAIDLYRRSVGAWPEVPAAWNNLGLLLMEQNNYIDAVDAFKTAARQDPSDPRPLINIGVAYDRTGWAEEALNAYIQALDRRPNDREALLGAITANHRVLGADRPALDRVRRALMVEQEPEVRSWLERERFRIEGRLASQTREDQVTIPPPSRPTPAGGTPARPPTSPN